MDDRSRYKLWVTCTKICTWENCWCIKSVFPYAAGYCFQQIIPAYMLQVMFKTFCEQYVYSFFHRLRILRICQLFNILILQLLQLTIWYAYIKYWMFFLGQAFKICLTSCQVIQQNLLQRVAAKPNTDVGLIIFIFLLRKCNHLFVSIPVICVLNLN